MQGYVRNYVDFMSFSKGQLIIPEYQRNYSWKCSNCELLFNDILRLSKDPSKNHFLGQLVIASNGYHRFIVDGQQRITSICLMLLAAIKAVKLNKLKINNEQLLEDTLCDLLKADPSVCNCITKLQLSKADSFAYEKIFHDESEDYRVLDSNITECYKLFCQLIETNASNFTFDSLVNALEHLMLCEVIIDNNDDQQLIFERLNATTLELSEIDKIRNFMLKSVGFPNSTNFNNDNWHKIEDLTKDKIDEFIKAYIAIQDKLDSPINKNSLYIAVKKYMEARDVKEELGNMLRHAKLFDRIIKSNLASPKLSETMRHIINLDISEVYVFLMQFLDYAQTSKLPVDEIYEVVHLIENYLARYSIKKLPVNELNKLFFPLHDHVIESINSSQEKNRKINLSYSNILAQYLVGVEGKLRMPSDEAFVLALKRCDMYLMKPATRLFFFERLENAQPGESNDIAKELKSQKATIEHIMPQTLTPSWINMLGQNYASIHKQYLHTFANLTLTGINSALSNNSFIDKRNGIDSTSKKSPGYKDSKYRMTRYVAERNQWTQVELEQRADYIAQLFLKLYPFPKINSDSQACEFETYILDDQSFDPWELYSLDDQNFDPTGKELVGFSILGQEYHVNSWRYLLVDAVKHLVAHKEEQVRALVGKSRDFVNYQKSDLYFEVGKDLYLFINLNNKDKLRVLRNLFVKLNIPQSKLLMKVAKTTNDEPKSKQEVRDDKKNTNDSPSSVIDDWELYSLDDHNFDPTGKEIVGFSILGQEYHVNSWRYLLVDAVKHLVAHKEEQVRALVGKSRDFVNYKKSDLYFEVGKDLYLFINLNNKDKLRMLRNLFVKLNIPQSKLLMKVAPIKNQ